MTGGRHVLGNYMGLAVVVALNLALFRGATKLLTIPAISTLLIMLDVALARLLIWRQPLRSSEYGFIATGFVATMITLPYNNHPHILQAIVELYRDASGDTRTFKFNNISFFIYEELAAVLGVLILAISLAGGALAGWGHRCLRRRTDRS